MAQIDRKVVRAPFAGRLGIRAVNLGQYLNPGTTLTVLEAIDSVYVDFSIPQQRLGDVKVGMPVRVTIESADAAPRDGVIAAIDPEIDSMTRSIKLRASVKNKEEKLRPGMFATVSVVLPQRAPAVSDPGDRDRARGLRRLGLHRRAEEGRDRAEAGEGRAATVREGG